MKNKIISNVILGGLLGVFFLNVYIIFQSQFNLFFECSYILDPFKEIGNKQAVGATVQLLVFLFTGGMIALCFSIMKLEQWSLAKQILLQYVLFAIGLFPLCFFMNYIERSVIGYVKYLMILALIYGVILCVEYVSLKINIREMNEKLEGKEHNKKLRFLPYIVLLLGLYYVVPLLFGLGEDFLEAAYATNLFNYFVYPFVITGIGIFAGIKLRINWIIPVCSGALIIPSSLFLYQDFSYTIVLTILMAGCATVGTLLGWMIGAVLRKGGVSI